MRFTLILFSLFSISSLRLCAQSDSAASASRLAEFSLEELMNIPIYSVSKTEESSFEAALSSSVVTREEIKRAGCTSIMEAMRLVPGVIVREQTNGSYDIHIRGLDNVPPNLGLYFFGNSTTLVMIDDRPVYNYLHGGTFWETLPVDLNDVEKIEVVRGPSTAMYGPNAESGVINIITRRPDKKGWYAVANGQYGNYNTGIANASLGYKVRDKFSVIASGNFQNRNRTQSDYYDPATDRYEPLDSFIRSDSVRHARYPHPDVAMRKYGYNLFLNYKINKRAAIYLQAGGQRSEIQDIFASNFLTTALATSYYGNLKAEVYGADLQVSYLAGTQQPQAGIYQGKWDFNTTDVTLDYHITQVKHLVITPGLSYRRAAYDDRRYVNETTREGLFNSQVISQTYAAFLRADARFFKDKLRLIAAARMDKFNRPSKLYWSWQFALTYKVSDKHILRIVESRANRAPLFLESYYNISVPFNLPGQPGTIQLLGNKNINLLTTDMLEIGYRGKLRDNLEVDLEVFGTTTQNFSNEIFTRIDSSATSMDYIYTFTNIPLVVRQFGATLSIHYIVGKFQFRPFITVQRTKLFNYSPYTVSPNAPASVFFAPSPTTQNINSGMGTQMTHVATPTVYGGAYINYAITSHLNVNLNPYFMSSSTELEAANLVAKNGVNGVENINPKFILNVAASYTFFKRLTLFANFKNCFSDRTREFYRGDIPGFKVSGGISFEY